MTPILILKIFIVAKLFEYLLFFILNILNNNNTKKHPNVPLTFKEHISQDEYQKSRSYSIERTKFSIISTSFDLTLLFLFIKFDGFAFLERYSSSLTQNEGLMAIIFCFIIAFGKEIIDMPLNIYHNFHLEEKYGFNKMTYTIFFKDFIIKLILSFVLGAPLIYFLITVIKKFGNAWWIYGFLGLSLFQIFLLWIYPTWIAPFFNKFTPLPDGDLRKGILQISQKINFPISEIFKMDGSKRSSHSNAYFTGFGNHRRIVLFDTLIQSLNHDELIAVLAHEMGHNKLKHIQKSILISFSLSFLGFYIWSFLIGYSNLYKAFGLTGNYIFPSLMIFPLIMGPVSFFISPLFNIFSRRNEYQADSFSCEVTESKNSMKSALLKLNKDNLSNLSPHPLYSFFYYSHPTLKERIQSIEKE